MYNPDVLPFQEIIVTPCLALLGEPGIGKSYAMQDEIKIIKESIKGSEKVLFFNLRSYGSEDRLIRDIFECKDFILWVNGDHRLHLFLDSLDECLLRINTLATLIIDELKKYPIDRLCLRIACRTAEWPVTLETGLQTLWGEDDFKAYELTPLRRIDVEDAAKANGFDPNLFLKEIEEKQIVPFAIKPVTLQFLINVFKKEHSLPTTQTDLYLNGCLKLCEEQSQQRVDTKLSGTYTAQQRMAIAARIAAITIFSNRYAIWTGRDLGNVPDEDVTVSAMVGGTENFNGNEFEVTEDSIRETLNTGLFSSRGINRMGWAHQTYAEYLAAWYVVKNQMALPQIKSLVTHPEDPEGKLVPQLHETAAWLACMIPNFIKEIIKTDPEVLLRSDIATIDVHNIEKLVTTLLEFIDSEKLYLHREGVIQIRHSL
jgi:predicted NACHT family NTPase